MVLDVKAVTQHTGFALDHLVPQQPRSSAANAKKTNSVRFRQKF